MIFDEIDLSVGIDRKPSIKVVGVGGGGGNAVDRMVENDVRGVEFIAMNTDAQDLQNSSAATRLVLGLKLTGGLGAGGDPEVGRQAAEESVPEIRKLLTGAQMVFITAGMGGGTGTGAAPIIASVAKELGCLTVGIVTKPFNFEGPLRMQKAIAGLQELKKYVDTLIVIPNERLKKIVDISTGLLDAFREVDNILRQGVQGIAELISVPGMINVDFADVRSVIKDKGTALMGIGIARGPNRAIEAARKAIHSSLLEVSIDGATDALVNITASESMTLHETEAAINEIRNCTTAELNIFYGTAFNNDLNDEFIVTVVATGYDLKAREAGIEDIQAEIYRSAIEQEEEVAEEEDESLFLSKKEIKKLKKEEKKKTRDKKAKPSRVEQELNKNTLEEIDIDLPDWLKN